VNEEDADRKKPGAEEEEPGDTALGCGGEGDPRLDDGEEESEVAEADHVDVSIDFGAAILEEGADIPERSSYGGGVSCSCGVSGSGKACADVAGVLVKDEDGKDVAEEHTGEDEGDAVEEEKAATAQFGKGGRHYERSLVVQIDSSG